MEKIEIKPNLIGNSVTIPVKNGELEIEIIDKHFSIINGGNIYTGVYIGVDRKTNYIYSFAPDLIIKIIS